MSGGMIAYLIIGIILCIVALVVLERNDLLNSWWDVICVLFGVTLLWLPLIIMIVGEKARDKLQEDL